MPRPGGIDAVIFPAFDAIREEGFRRGGSLFTPGLQLWDSAVLREVADAIAPEDVSDSDFISKLLAQLEPVSPRGIQLAAELLYVVLLPESDTGGAAKRKHVEAVLGMVEPTVAVPAQLAAALDGGIASYGMGSKMRRDGSLRYLARLLGEWFARGAAEREALLDDPWRFRDLSQSLDVRRGDTEREAILYVLFPDTFEPMVSRDHKRRIVQAFAAYAGDGDANVDAKLAEIRETLEQERGRDFDFYDGDLQSTWRPQPEAPRRIWFIRGANDHGVNRIPPWLTDGYVSIGGADIADLRVGMTVEELRDHFLAVDPAATPARVRMDVGNADRFLHRMRQGDLVVTVDGDSTYLGTIDGPPEPRGSAEGRAMWQRDVRWLNADAPLDRASFPDVLRLALKTRVTLTELTKHHAVIEQLLGTEGESEPGTASGSPRERLALPAPGETIAAATYLPLDWLTNVVALLERRRQLIFYGPPGTGKTFVAQRLGDHFAAHGGRVELIQFHPSYTYEDFFEGYRPQGTNGGSLAFRLVPGPLKTMAEQARANPTVPHLLVIDEINRGNLAKIFGELYFLLEYRDRAVRLQYSPDVEFSLPENLYVIGTMNTADRSIALVDSALRRRFYFVGFLPQEEPVRGVLRRWAEATGRETHMADLLDALNAKLGDPDFAVGPSYFMQGDDLETIWAYGIRPLLEERFYGSRRRIDDEFGWEALRRPAAPQAESGEAA